MVDMHNLKFRISTGLKNIIGRELITDKLIAIFELVKNSYDAGATRVDITFENINSENGTITISDNGSGMSEYDIVNKWLFVAYSEKNGKRSGTYRDEYTKRAYAGAKGIGRFSCDRLGSKLELYSRKSATEKVNLLSVDWDKFEEDSREEFVDIPVKHQYVDSLPNHCDVGTSVAVKNLREDWDRTALLGLKKSLARLINPYGDANKAFEIFLWCKEESLTDKQTNEDRKIVNGKVSNYIFESLNLKTTQISVSISENGELVTTKMFDRGIFLFELTQESKYFSLKNTSIELFYLNTSAKHNFTKTMGIQPVRFGSIFVYKNGFRVMPYGEPDVDVFGLERRKNQGYNRYLGTRDLMGRIMILGENSDFIETTSRDGGFISSKSLDELSDFYMSFAHRPLEKYVVELIKWGDEGKNGENVVNPDDIRKEIIRFITGYERKGRVVSLNINPDFSDIVEERKNKQSETDISTLKSLAKQFDNYELDKLAQRVEKQNQELRKDRQALSEQTEKITDELENRKAELQATKKQALFLRELVNPRIENATKSLHLMNTYAKSIKLNVDKIAKELNKSKDENLKLSIQSSLYEIVKSTQKINGTFTIAFSAGYDMNCKSIKMNLYDFISQFVQDALLPNTGDFIEIEAVKPLNPIEVIINPTEFGIAIENIVYNSYKAKAKKIVIKFLDSQKYVDIIFTDNGSGLNSNISDANRIFEFGFTTTDGSGVGLAHSKKIFEDMGGELSVNVEIEKGFELKARINK